MNIEEIKPKLGNWFMGYDNMPFQFEKEEMELYLSEKCDLDEIIKSPVLLTVNLLSWNQFVEMDCFYSFKDKTLVLYELGDEEFKLACINKEYYMYSWTLKQIVKTHPIKYVHTLQNIFEALTETPLNFKI